MSFQNIPDPEFITLPLTESQRLRPWRADLYWGD
jgi:hypothetical protein